MGWQHPTGNSPKAVTLVALGPTRKDYFEQAARHTPEVVSDEVWTLNTGIRYMKHDVAFIMDDMMEFATHFPAYGEEMRKATSPIITSVKYAQFPAAVQYPLAEVLTVCQPRPYFNNSVPYIIAYAYMIGVKEMSIYGADYTFPGMKAREDGRACVEYWCGWAEAKGMVIRLPSATTLMDANRGLRFYGYLRQPKISFDGGSLPVDPEVLSEYNGMRESELTHRE